jgi:type I restriction enzyme S subunit
MGTDNWQIVQMSSMAKIISGYAFKSSDFQEEGVPVIKIKNVGNGFVEITEVDCVDEHFLTLGDEYHVDEGDILISLTGSHISQPGSVVGRVAVAQGLGMRCLLNQRVGKVLFNSQAMPHRRFIYYALASEHTRRNIALMAHGAASQANVSPKQIESMDILVPPLPTQKKIASILSAYDDLIENNNRRIKILEEMAQNIYREWFVHFRYPGHEDVPMVDSELGQIPQGWEVKTVVDLVNRERPGKLFSQKTVLEQGDVPVLDQGKSGIIGYHDESPGVLASLAEPIIIFANHTCYQRIIMFPFSAIQNVLPFRPHPQLLRNIYWLHWATKDLVAFNDYKGHWPEFMAKSLPVPPYDLSDLFGGIAEQIVQLSFRLDVQTQNLRKTRDLLLSKLISGQLDVEELDIEV